MTKTQISNVGRMAAFRLTGSSQVLYGNVIDLITGTNEPKRIRIQKGEPTRHGDIIMPSQYDFAWWADEEEST
jgi:hypothetical protein